MMSKLDDFNASKAWQGYLVVVGEQSQEHDDQGVLGPQPAVRDHLR